MTPARHLLRTYVAYRGLFARIAKKLGMDASYISRVANGKRRNETVTRAIDAELKKMLAASKKIAQASGKRPGVRASKIAPRVRH